MNDGIQAVATSKDFIATERVYCNPDAPEHCITCSDDAQRGYVLQVHQIEQTALIRIGDTCTEIDISLVNTIMPGDQVLIHAGVAIASIQERGTE